MDDFSKDMQQGAKIVGLGMVLVVAVAFVLGMAWQQHRATAAELTPPQIITVPVEGGRCHVLVEGGQQKPLGCWREWPPVVGQGGGRALEPGPVLR